MRLIFGLVLGILLVLLAACVPERVVWTPDGTHAAVIGGDGLYLCDSSGKMGPRLLEGRVQQVVWLPDGTHLLIERQQSFDSWQELLKANPAMKVDPAVAARVRAELVAHPGDPAKDLPIIEQDLKDMPKELRRRAMMFLYDTDAPLAATLGKDWRKNAIGEISALVCQRYELVGERLIPGPILSVGLEDYWLDMRLSPKDDFVAVSMVALNNESPATGEGSLKVIPLSANGGTALEFGPTSLYPDWTPDGRAIVSIKPEGVPMEGAPASLLRRTVVDEHGKLFDAQAIKEEDLAAVLFGGLARVRCTPDNRILFTSPKVSFPATPDDVNATARIFSLQPGEKPVISQLPDVGDKKVEYFELSPDGKYISIPSNNGPVGVMNLATGVLTIVQKEDLAGAGRGSSLESIPSWRSPGELTVLVNAEKPEDGSEVAVYSIADGKSRVISAGWPDAVKADWLKSKPQATEPQVPATTSKPSAPQP